MLPLLTPLGLLVGHTAIRFAEENGLHLNKYATGIEKAKHNLTPEEARRIAKSNPELIWLNIA